MQRNSRKLRSGILALDLVLMPVVLVCASALADGVAGLAHRMRGRDAEYIPILVASLASWAFIYGRMKLDGFRRGWSWGKVASEIIIGLAMMITGVAALAYAFRGYVPWRLLLYFGSLLVVVFVTVRALAHFVVRSGSVIPRRRAVIIGNGRVARELSAKLKRHPELSCEVVGFLYPSALESENVLGVSEEQRVPIEALGVVDSLRRRDVTDVIAVSQGQRAPHGTLDLINRCRAAGLRVSVVPLSYELYLSRPSLMDLDGLPLISLNESSRSWSALASKRALDIVVGLPAAVLLLPLAALPAIYLKFRTGKAFRRETRCGRDARLFPMYRLNVDRDNPTQPFERFLNETSLSEAPQLLNVLCGHMSLVGPRPETPERVKHYSEWQRQRLTIRPGMTGLAQVHGLRDRHSSEEKARFDLQYIVSCGPFSDCVLLLQTAWTLALRFWAGNRDSGQVQLGWQIPYSGSPHADSTQSSAD